MRKNMKTKAIIKGDLILKKDTVIKGDLIVKGNVIGKDGERFNLTVEGNLNCNDLNCWNLNCRNLNCNDLNCYDLDCNDLSFYAIAITYNSFKCKTWKAERDNYVIKCLDGKIQGKQKKEKR